MPEVTMGTVRERTDITPEGTFEKYLDIEYFVDDARHHLRMSPEKFSAKAAEEAVKREAAEFVAVAGKKITLGK